MPHSAGRDDRRPPALQRLLSAEDASVREQAWGELIDRYSRLILHAVRASLSDHDGVMDRYAYVLEELRANDYRRLRKFSADGRSEFSTWLVVVTQRICVDRYRQLYGRSRNGGDDFSGPEHDRLARRRLMDLLTSEIDVASIADTQSADAELNLRAADLHAALESALQQLDPHERLLIKLRFEDGLGVPEIARTLELPSRFHVYRKLNSVLERMRQALAESGVHTSAP